jgi:GYF domain 2
MNYRIKRGDQEFGPYSLADLQRYVQDGHVAPDDMALSEGMTEWIPVSQVLGNIPPSNGQSAPGIAGMELDAAAAQQIVPLPPNLHWGWLLLLNIITRSYFNMIWAFIQANWARKLSGKNTALVLVAMYPAGMISGVVIAAIGGSAGESGMSGFGGILIIAGVICLIVSVFKIKDAMEEYYNTVENIGLSLSGAMTFFFSVIYIQYHINRIARWKKTGVLS